MKYFFLLLIISACSCETTSRIKKSDINPISNKFEGAYDNKPYLIRSNLQVTKKDYLETAVSLFDTSQTLKSDLDFIQINFNSKGQLCLHYKDTSVFKATTLNGKFSKKGYYEIYFKKEQLEIPPVVHVLFSTHDIQRLRIYETKSDDLIVYYYNYISGNFLFVGDGPSKMQFFFHKIK
ncbi:hypothetical protein [Pinibacter aurantiacus]|uniref:Lipoprotein n=1 Tax=Pinibacter aurantiacus TaxID=2851599 RepID=A0A9E2W2L5_9BACT|nr:hypothetical protein [Pinibacter aurantiacus]MBV4357465.1 hypothetical protein [Pinibacter aurantiacus]